MYPQITINGDFFQYPGSNAMPATVGKTLIVKKSREALRHVERLPVKIHVGKFMTTPM